MVVSSPYGLEESCAMEGRFREWQAKVGCRQDLSLGTSSAALSALLFSEKLYGKRTTTIVLEIREVLGQQ